MKKKLRSLVEEGRTVPALGATDALSAKLIAAHGFECVYVGSYATAASRFGLPDTGLLALPEAGANMVFPTLAGPAELAAVRARVARPAMVVDMPGRALVEHKGAAVVLFYGFSVLAQLAGVKKALEDFSASGAVPGGAEGLERFLDYRGFAERSRRYKG